MPIRVAGLHEGLEAQRICHGSLVGDNEYEVHGKRITRGGRGAVSAVVVKTKPGFRFVQEKDGRFRVEKEPASTLVAETQAAD